MLMHAQCVYVVAFIVYPCTVTAECECPSYASVGIDLKANRVLFVISVMTVLAYCQG